MILYGEGELAGIAIDLLKTETDQKFTQENLCKKWRLMNLLKVVKQRNKFLASAPAIPKLDRALRLKVKELVWKSSLPALQKANKQDEATQSIETSAVTQD